MPHQNNHARRNEEGLVSIMVASVLMVIMALITIGFTRAVQSEQRQAVDNQLSKQAFYAAESGINVAASSPGFPGNLKQDCDVSAYNNGVISTDEPDIAFTCIQINPTPEDLVFGNDSITTNKARVVPIRTSSQPKSITFQWNDANNSVVETGCDAPAEPFNFERNAQEWGKVSPLRLELIRIPSGPITRDTLLSNHFSALFYPCDASGRSSVDYSSMVAAATQGSIIPVNCTNSGEYECRIEITGLDPANTQEYYAKFNAVYSEITVRITALSQSDRPLAFSDSQAVVDSTGRAVDVFRRLQARIPLYDAYVQPSAAIQTLDDICKLYDVQQNNVIDGCQ